MKCKSFLAFSTLLGVALCAVAQPDRAVLAVDESRSQIQTSRNVITPILAVENHGEAETEAQIEVELLDTADGVRASDSLDVSLRPGLNQVSIPFRTWTQKVDDWNDTVWYRVRYSVRRSNDKTAVASGKLALAAKAEGMFDLRIVTSRRSVPGKPLRVRVYARSLSTLLPASGIHLDAELAPDEEKVVIQLSSSTNNRGYAEFEFKIPAQGWGDSAALKIVARKGPVVREATEEVSLNYPLRFFVTTDKPLYQPGQVVHVRTLIQDWTRHALGKIPLVFSIEDEEHTLAFRATATTSRFGVASVDWTVPENVRLGDYAIKVETDSDSDDDSNSFPGFQSIRITRYELPTFTVNVATDRGYYLPGQAASVTITGDYLFGKPVTKGHVKVARESERHWNYKQQRWDITAEDKWEGDTDSAGKFVAHIGLTSEQDQLQGLSDRFRDLDYAAYFTDTSTKKTEQRRFRLRISRDPIHLYVIESGNSAAGHLPIDFYVSASYADGSPAKCEVAIYQGSPGDDRPGALLRTVKTNRYGVAKIQALNLPPLPEATTKVTPSATVVFEAHDREDRRGRETQDFWESNDHLLIRVNTSHALYRPEEAIDVDLYTNQREAELLLDVVRDGRIVYSQPVHVRNSHSFLVVPYSPDFEGELAVVAYSPLEAEGPYYYGVPMGTRTVIYPHDPALKVSAKFDRASYRPGEEAVLDLRVKGTTGSPVEAALGSVIFDQAVEERARTDAEFGRGYGFHDIFRSYWYEPAELGGLKREDLDRLDVSQPFADDLQLAAEILLLNRWYGEPPLVFGGAGYPDSVASVFRNLLNRELVPVETALDAAYTNGMSYPHDDSSLRRILTEHGVDFDQVLDPWGSTFRTKFLFQKSYAVMELTSPGPDKKFGTADDISALNISRWYFAPTASSIRNVMAEYHNRTGNYIHDFTTLKTELAAQNVRWEDLRDPWGHVYAPQFGVSNSRFTLTVMSAGPNGKFESDPAADDFPVWTDSSDYFSETTLKVDSALARSFAKNQKFPQSEGDFYKVLDDAQIPRALLVDAWGRGARVVFDNQARFVDRVVMDYSNLQNEGSQPSNTIQPETADFAFIHLYSAGQDGIPGNSDDFELAVFSREIARQNSTMVNPSATPAAIPLSGGSGAITGVVIDPSGAVVPNVKITARFDDRVPFETKTDANGRYTFRNLPTGFYVVSAQATGFAGVSVTRVPVRSLTTTEVNLTLRVGAVTETVEVSAEVSQLQTQSTETASVVSRPPPHAEGNGLIVTPRLREFFPETLLWEPLLETDRQGNSRLHFKFADSITNWKVSLVASTVDGQIGLLDTNIKTFQPFFIEHEPPAVLTQGDEIALPVVLRNYLDRPQTMRVEMKSEPWFTLQSPAARETSVAAGESESATFRFHVTGSLGEVKQRVTAANHHAGDAVEKPLRIHPDGQPGAVTAARLFSAQGDLDLYIPDNLIPGSLQAELKLYPNLMAHVLESAHSLLEKPYGCGEQTVSSTYPNLMILRLYQHSGKATDSTYRVAFRFLQLGYARLLSYQHEDGGVSVWKQEKPDLALTAYALRFLSDASEFIDVDSTVIARMQRWLLHQQDSTGAWREGTTRDSVSETAYLAIALQESRHSQSAHDGNDATVTQIDSGVQQALNYLRAHWSASNDPYAIAQVALAAFLSADKDLGLAATERLRTLAHPEGASSYWELETNTLFHGWGAAGRAETTALVLEALSLAAGVSRQNARDEQRLIENGLLFLIRTKDELGSWYSGQTTINVLESFLLLAQPSTGAPGDAVLAVNGEKVADLKLPGPFDIVGPLQVDISQFVKPGKNHISISRAAGSQTASAQAVVRYYLPWEKSVIGRTDATRTGNSDALALRVHYDHTQVQAGDSIRCLVHAERIGFRGYGMLLAEIGLPPGAVVDRATLEKAMTGDSWSISQYEVRPDRLVVYLWPKEGGTDFEFSFRLRYGLNALTAPSLIYDYYNPDAQALVPPSRIEVQ